MNFQNIEYFLTVVEYGNFSKAAESLFISQQSLSENIRRLEDEVGAPLLIRGKTVSLTPAGECFASGGRKLLKTQDRMLREISVITNTTRCKVVLGVSPFDLPPFLPLAMSEFTRKYPEYEVIVASPLSNEVPDFIFQYTELPKNTEGIPLILEDPWSVVVNQAQAYQIYGSDWETKERELREKQELSVLKDMPFLLLYEKHRMDPLYQQIFETAGFTPVEGFKSGNASLLSTFCTNGNGAFLGPQDYCCRKFGTLLDPQTGTLICYPLKAPAPVNLYLAYPKAKRLNQAEKRFAEVVRRIISEK